jgi:hypothetical protein
VAAAACSGLSSKSTLPEDTPLRWIVLQAKRRWSIERDRQDLQQEPEFRALRVPPRH